jgi:hypothetical protein
VYLNSRGEIPGEGVKKGLRYGLAIALLWLLAMLEGVSLFGNPVINELVVGLSDAIPVFMLGILLSKLQTEKAESDRPVTFSFRKSIKAVSIYTGLFLAGRYIAYFSGIIQSGTQTRPLETFIWTLLMGISIGTVYVILGNNRNERSLKHGAMKFGLLIFGLNWAAFLVFMPLIFSGYLADVLLRIIIDTTLVMVSSYLTSISGGKLIIKKSKSEESIELLKGAFEAENIKIQPGYIRYNYFYNITCYADFTGESGSFLCRSDSLSVNRPL